MSSREFSEWVAFYQVEEEDRQRDDAVRQAQRSAAGKLAQQSPAYRLAQQRGLLPKEEAV